MQELMSETVMSNQVDISMVVNSKRKNKIDKKDIAALCWDLSHRR